MMNLSFFRVLTPTLDLWFQHNDVKKYYANVSFQIMFEYDSAKFKYLYQF